MRHTQYISDKQKFYKLVYLLVFIFFLFLLVKSLSQSVLFAGKDRINLFVYDDHARYYSLSQTGSVDYMVEFNPDTEVIVPGGYNYYRFGALGWLVNQEKKPDIIKKTSSSATATFTDMYFYPGGSKIYYSANKSKGPDAPAFYKLLFYKSNANFFDRLYLVSQFLLDDHQSFNVLKNTSSQADFVKKYQGHFYQKTYRNDNKIVQIIYTNSYNNAANISNILEGNGIRVGDLTVREKESDRKCIVNEEGVAFSKTSKDIAGFFDCDLQHGKTGTFDIIIELNKAEHEWDIN